MAVMRPSPTLISILIRGRNIISAYVAPNSPANDGPNMDYLTIKRAVGNP